MANVYPLPRRTPKTAPRPKATRYTRRQHAAAGALMAVALVLTGLSLTHLSHGIQIVTGCSALGSWALAVGVDLGYVTLELAGLVAGAKVDRDTRRWRNGAIVGTLSFSAALNALAFGAGATGWLIYPAVLLGVCIPALIYAMTRVGAAMWLDR